MWKSIDHGKGSSHVSYDMFQWEKNKAFNEVRHGMLSWPSHWTAILCARVVNPEQMKKNDGKDNERTSDIWNGDKMTKVNRYLCLQKINVKNAQLCPLLFLFNQVLHRIIHL